MKILCRNVTSLNFIFFSIFVFFILCIYFLIVKDHQKSRQPLVKLDQNELSNSSLAVKEPSLDVLYPHVTTKNVPLYTTLKQLDVSSVEIVEMVKAIKPIKDLSRLNPGIRFKFTKDDQGRLQNLEFKLSAVETLVVNRKFATQVNPNTQNHEPLESWQAEIQKETVDVKTITFVGHVDTTLWDSALNAQMDPYLIVAMAEIFGWEVDFNREVQVGDSWRLTAEKKYVKGLPVGWGSILAAEYINQGSKHTAVLFRQNGEDKGYYNLNGENLRRMFLKSPLRFGRVTSRFNRRRFHPKLKILRAHNGVDYGAPIGTPVQSVASGTVTFARYSGGGGKVLKIRHNSTYETAYKHLSRYAKGIRIGAQVKQGQVVAYTGNTGLSTGPHLHYEFFVNGRFVDPMRQKFPSAEPISTEHKSLFLSQAEELIASLPNWNNKEFSMDAPTSWAQHITPIVSDNFYSLVNSNFWYFDSN